MFIESSRDDLKTPSKKDDDIFVEFLKSLVERSPISTQDLIEEMLNHPTFGKLEVHELDQMIGGWLRKLSARGVIEMKSYKWTKAEKGGQSVDSD